MNCIKNVSIAGAVALALSGATAMAQGTVGGNAGAAAAGTSARATTSTPGIAGQATGTTRTVTSGCAGGSSCASSQNYQPLAQTGSTPAPGGTPGVTSDTPTSNGTDAGTTTNTTGSGVAVTGTTTVDPATTRPGSFEPGGAFDTSGTTSGTGTGTTSGLGVVPTTGFDVNGNPVVFPGNSGAIVTDGGAQGTTQQNVVVQPPQPAPARVRTPLLDEAARNVQARDARRKATGTQPRVIGIAPRTDRDLTDQMPDDPIVRY